MNVSIVVDRAGKQQAKWHSAVEVFVKQGFCTIKHWKTPSLKPEPERERHHNCLRCNSKQIHLAHVWRLERSNRLQQCFLLPVKRGCILFTALLQISRRFKHTPTHTHIRTLICHLTFCAIVLSEQLANHRLSTPYHCASENPSPKNQRKVIKLMRSVGFRAQ